MYAGNEIRSVIMHGDRFSKYPIGKIDGTYTWQVCSCHALRYYLWIYTYIYIYIYEYICWCIYIYTHICVCV